VSHIKDKKVHSLLISAYQSHFFNAWLAKRVMLMKASQHSQLPLLAGEIMMPYPEGEVFSPKINRKIITEYALKLNGKKAISIEKLDVNDERLKGITLLTKWSTYALVQFKYEKSKHLKMVFESPLYGRGRASFSKVAKYVFMKKAF